MPVLNSYFRVARHCSNLGHVRVGTAFITYHESSETGCEQVRFCQQEPGREVGAQESANRTAGQAPAAESTFGRYRSERGKESDAAFVSACHCYPFLPPG